jgi:hypothetical protein
MHVLLPRAQELSGHQFLIRPIYPRLLEREHVAVILTSMHVFSLTSLKI